MIGRTRAGGGDMDRRRTVVDYRNRAELLRTAAAEMPHAYHKESLRRAAEYYEAQADLLERELKAMSAAVERREL